MPFKGRRPQEGMKEELNLKGTFWAFSSGNFDECCIQENTELGTWKENALSSPGFSTQPTMGNNGSQDSNITPVQIARGWRAKNAIKQSFCC